MGKYKVRIKVELVECNDTEQVEPTMEKDGCFSMTISEKDAISIDNCESAVLQTAHPTIRAAISKHLSEISKKALEEATSAKVIANKHPYKVDGEVGRFEFVTHSTLVGDQVKYNTACDLFAVLKAKEFYKTIGFKEIAMIYGDTENSYRKTTRLINRFRYQETGGTPYRTLQDNTEQEGAQLTEYKNKISDQILQKNGFDPAGVYHGDKVYGDKTPATLSFTMVTEAAEKVKDKFDLDELLDNPVLYEDPQKSVNITIDDVNVKRQEETREKGKDDEERKRKYVHNTVVHVEKEKQKYVLNGHGIKTVLLYVIAFVFNNDLASNRFQFFTDGHKTLNATIFKCFSWYRNMGIILDWYHLEKKCKEQLSLGMKGRGYRNQVLEALKPLLWHGLTDKAIALIDETDSTWIKNTAAMEKLKVYLNRNKPYIPCYAIRKELGLCNSSSIGEKMNDLVVAVRQKHNGMSWSKPGSVALASITSLKRNDEYRNWFENKALDFKLAA